MKDKWLNDIHDRMADFEIEEPVGLWDDITANRPKRHAVVPPRYMRAIAVAAMLAVVFTLIYMFVPSRPITVDAPVNHPSSGLLTESPHTPAPANTEPTDPIPVTAQLKRHKSLISKSSSTMPAIASTPIPSPLTESDNKADSTSLPDSPSPADAEPTDFRPNPYRTVNRLTTSKIQDKNISSDSPLQFSIYTSGSAGATNRAQAFGGNEPISTGTNGALWEDSAMLGIIMLNKGKDIKTDIHHRLPIRAGLNIAFRLTDRMALESGLTYANLISDIREGSDNHYMSAEQTLHYIGIPLNLKYRVASWKRLSLYASSGVLAEKCVSGKTYTDYIIDRKVSESETTDAIVRPLQWSVNASAGIQFDITSNLGLYAEPGVACYFDNGSDIKTIYKDKPVNFNINIGLRFTVGQ